MTALLIAEFRRGNQRWLNSLDNRFQELDGQPISAPLDLLGQVRPTAAFPKTHHGIQ